MMSVNGKLMLEPYKSSGKLEASTKNAGYSTIKQKDTLVGLKAVADGRVNLGKDTLEVKKGQVVYFPEEVLFAFDWAKKTLHLDGSEERFILADAVHAVAVV